MRPDQDGGCTKSAGVAPFSNLRISAVRDTVEIDGIVLTRDQVERAAVQVTIPEPKVAVMLDRKLATKLSNFLAYNVTIPRELKGRMPSGLVLTSDEMAEVRIAVDHARL